MAGSGGNGKGPSRAEKLRRKRLERRLTRIALAVLSLAVCALILLVVLSLRRGGRDAAVAAPTPVQETALPTAEATPSPIPEATPEATPLPTAEPTPAPTPLYGAIGIYLPTGKGNQRVRTAEFTGKWKKGEDIDCFEIVASAEEALAGDSFRDIFGAAWYSNIANKGRRIGLRLQYTLTDGTEIAVNVRSPKDISHTEYVEMWLYDDLHQTPGAFYSHLKESKMTDETLITSVKLTCGSKIAEVQDMSLSAFLYAGPEDFGPDGGYAGQLIWETRIHRAA